MSQKNHRKNPLKIVWVIIGFLSLALGSIGVVLPILPTVPFFMATVFCFAKSSERLHRWFIGTSLYRKHLESFVERRAMTLRAKLSVMGTVTAVMLVGFIMMDEVMAGRICLTIVWVFHVLYFMFRIKTIKQEERLEKE